VGILLTTKVEVKAMDQTTFLIGAAIALIVVLIIGSVVFKAMKKKEDAKTAALEARAKEAVQVNPHKSNIHGKINDYADDSDGGDGD
jgi:uncharacterized protein HemX